MKQLASTLVLLGAVFGLFTSTANAQTVDELKKELAAKKAEIARLEKRVQELETRGAAPTRPIAPQPTFAPPPPPGPADEEADRALEQTLVREGALVLSPFTYEVTPSFSWAHWDKVQEPF